MIDCYLTVLVLYGNGMNVSIWVFVLGVLDFDPLLL